MSVEDIIEEGKDNNYFRDIKNSTSEILTLKIGFTLILKKLDKIIELLENMKNAG
jgi:hypothetical protein